LNSFPPPLTITWQLVRGVFVWWRLDTWTSALIGWFGAGYYSHIDVVTPDGLLRGARSASAESLEDMVDIAITECERFFPAFQFVLWGGKAPTDALQAAMLECVGEA